MRRLLILVLICLPMISALGQEVPMLNLPYDSAKRLVSPDGFAVLYGVPYKSGVNDGPQLWIEQIGAHRQKMLVSIGSTLKAFWSPDGGVFAVNDHWASDSAAAYIYDVRTLDRTDLGVLILRVDPEARRFAPGHDYFDLMSWEDAQHATVRFHGHTDKPPVECFDLRYRVSRSGTVEKLSQKIVPIDKPNHCD